jgi:hypothetical protein
MDDQFLQSLRSVPPSEFAARLRARLCHQPVEAQPRARLQWTWRAAATAGAAVLAVALFTFAPVRASAQAFLNLFRVTEFAAVPVDLDRLNRVGASGLDIPHIIGQQVQASEPGAPRVYAAPADAAAAAGIPLSLPQVLPDGLSIVRTEVEGSRSVQVTGDTAKLQEVLDALGITDEPIPAGLDGQVATLRVPAVVRVVYANGSREVSLMQARSPEAELPAGVDPVELGRIAFRVAGLDANEAQTLAQAIDWRGTLIVPVPAGASSFRQVDVRGVRGLLIEATDRRDARALMWSRNGIVYGLAGGLNDVTLLQVAESVP